MKPLKGEQPIEDMAISCLLEIDQREDQESGQWHRRSFISPRSKIRSYSSHGSCNRHQINRPRLSASRRYDENQQKPQSPIPKEVNSSAGKQARNSAMTAYNDINKFNEGEYWSSRVNWMAGQDGERTTSQPKLNKKISFGYEVYSRKNSRKGNSGDEVQRRRRKQYRTNLIYSLINNEEMRKLHKSSPSKAKNYKKKEELTLNPAGKQQNGLKNPVQDYMREVYNRVRECHHENQILRPSEHERSVLIRELLINLGNIKDLNCFAVQQSNPQTQIQQDFVQVAKINHRRVYRPEQKHALQLNKQIESIGKNTYKPPKSTALFVNKK